MATKPRRKTPGVSSDIFEGFEPSDLHPAVIVLANHWRKGRGSSTAEERRDLVAKLRRLRDGFHSVASRLLALSDMRAQAPGIALLLTEAQDTGRTLRREVRGLEGFGRRARAAAENVKRELDALEALTTASAAHTVSQTAYGFELRGAELLNLQACCGVPATSGRRGPRTFLPELKQGFANLLGSTPWQRAKMILEAFEDDDVLEALGLQGKCVALAISDVFGVNAADGRLVEALAKAIKAPSEKAL